MPNLAPFLLFDDARDDVGGDNFLFENAVRWVIAHEANDLPAAWSALDEAKKQGLWAAGFCSYELGYAMEKKLLPRLPQNRDVPMLYFGLFHAPKKIARKDTTTFLKKHAGAEAVQTPVSPAPRWSEKDYATRFQKVRDYLYAGDTYQVNLTFPFDVMLNSDAVAFYRRARMAQRAAYGALLCLPDHTVLSFSPELFFKIDGEVITAEPMKGTGARAMLYEDDKRACEAMQMDEKIRAENVMIVDLTRHDLTPVAKTGSVTVPELFTIKTFPTIHQMISRVQANLRDDKNAWDVLRAMFPCGSITGAPKIRAMEIIHEMEENPRGIYCGAIGYVAPNGNAQFNVAIRTLHVGADGHAVGGIGGGLLVDSVMQDEYQECLLKASFLNKDTHPFTLFETLLWTKKDGFYLLGEHMQRIAHSAAYFGFRWNEDKARAAMNAALIDGDCLRIRLDLTRDGQITTKAQHFVPLHADVVWRVRLCETPINSRDVFFYHKTSRRSFYEKEYKKAVRDGFDEVIFMNEKGEITEGSRTNLFWREGDQWFTPPVSCGLLPGILRGAMITQGTQEKTLALPALRAADEMKLGNSLRGAIGTKLFFPPSTA